MAEVLVPEAPGVLAAFGLLAAAIEHHHARTLQARTDAADLAALNRCLEELDAAGRARMREEGVPAAEMRVAYAADMRYVGQAYELEVPVTVPVTVSAVPGIDDDGREIGIQRRSDPGIGIWIVVGRDQEREASSESHETHARRDMFHTKSFAHLSPDAN